MMLPIGFVIYCWVQYLYFKLKPKNCHEDIPQLKSDLKNKTLIPHNKLTYFLWYISIFGIAISIVPCIITLYPILQPYIAILDKIKWIYEVTAYYICTRLLMIAYNHSSGYKDIIALTGLILSIPAMYVSSRVHDVQLKGEYVGLLFFASSLPITFLFNSSIIGFFNIASLFQMLGFVIAPVGSGYLIGFIDDTLLNTVTLVSLIMIFMYLVELYWHIQMLTLFHTGMIVFGPIMFGIVGLVKSGNVNDRNFILVNFAYIMFLTLFLVLGVRTHTKSLFNTSSVFIVLWVLEKLIMNIGSYTWFIVLGVSGGLWKYLVTSNKR